MCIFAVIIIVKDVIFRYQRRITSLKSHQQRSINPLLPSAAYMRRSAKILILIY